MKKNTQKTTKGIINLFPFFILLSSLIVGCNVLESGTGPTAPAGEMMIDPVFSGLLQPYKTELGQVIAPARQQGNKITQFTVNGQLVYDPDAPALDRFRWAPLGRSIIIPEPAAPPPQDPSLLYVGGHIIHPYFTPWYEKHKEQPLDFGLPLTEPRENDDTMRIEQYFENVGMFYDKKTGKVGFLAYGLYACDLNCRSDAPFENNRIGFYPSHVAFVPFIEKYGADFTGNAIFPAFTNQAGELVQIFEYVVLTVDPSQPANPVIPLPIATLVPYLSDPPAPFSGNLERVFVPVKGADLGYEVPRYFWEYLERHGGLAISGMPISHYHHPANQQPTQCFANLCLQYEAGAVESRRVHLFGLGYAYRALNEHSIVEAPQAQPAVTPSITPKRKWSIRVWEASQSLHIELQQEIFTLVLLNSAPFAGAQPLLILTYPNGQQVEFSMSLTDMNGQSMIRLPQLQANNGDIFHYEVCAVIVDSDDYICDLDSFMIWNNP